MPGARFAVLGYGSLGGEELGFGSDLDLVFLYDTTGGADQSDGARPLDASRWFARLAQKVVALLGTVSAAGRLFEERVSHEGNNILTFDPSGLPSELVRRLLLRLLATVAPDRIPPRGQEVQRLATGLHQVDSPVFDASGRVCGAVGIVDMVQQIGDVPSDLHISQTRAAAQTSSKLYQSAGSVDEAP